MQLHFANLRLLTLMATLALTVVARPMPVASAKPGEIPFNSHHSSSANLGEVQPK